MVSRIKRAYLFSLPVFALATAFVFTQACSRASAASSINKGSDGLALKGYDVVAYFIKNKPVKGNKEFQHEWMGATWQFSSASNRDLFAASPTKYAPQYGGYCAFGVSEGHKAPVDPNVWKIVEGKRYLNYDAGVGKEWQKDIPGRIAKADKNWPKVMKQ
jgi:YHS domain-containing protein